MNNEAIKIASRHIDLSKEELTQCADTLYNLLAKIKIEGNTKDKYILDAIATLQMQDIISQRLDKIKAFLQLLDQHVDLNTSHQYLREFAWENEVDQNDIDTMFNEYKG